MTTVNFDHDGESAFRTDLVGVDDAESNDPLVDDDGATEGGRALVTEGGRYALEITADGPWTVDCIQPTVDGVGLVSPPHTDSGSGVDYTGPVSVNETTELTGIHYGDGSFSVWAHTADENSYHLIEASRTAEKKTQPRIDGPTWLDVDADGEWHLELR